MEWLFLGIMLLGLLYLLWMIVGGLGGAPDLGLDDMLESAGLAGVFGLDTTGAGEMSGLGCGVIAAFLAGFGAVGLTGSIGGWNPLVMLLAAVIFGWLLARAVVLLLQFVYAQQSTSVFQNETLLGLSARVTIDSPAGKIGEAMVEAEEVRKYPVREINGHALYRGDTVEIVDVSGRVLSVRKKRQVEAEES